MKTIFRFVELVVSCSALAAIPAFSVAQTQSSPGNGTSSSANTGADAEGLTEIIITARRRAESVQEFPGSVTALSQQQLQTSGVQDLRTLAAVVPGINFNAQEPDHSEITIRGITSGNTPSPTVGFFVDDVAIDTIYQGSTGLNGQFEPVLFDTQRVEVLSGPQGTLYGGSALGGAVKYVSNPALLDRTSAAADAEVSAVDAGGTGYLTSLVVNAPVITDVAAIRFGAYYRVLPGFVDRVAEGVGLMPPLLSRPEFTSFNTTMKRNVNRYDTAAFRVAATIAPTSDWRIAPQFLFQNTQSSDVGTFWPNLPRFEQSFVTGQPTADRLLLGTLTVDGPTPVGTLTSVSSWAEQVENTTRDVSAFVGGAVPMWASLISPSVEGFVTHRVSQEFRITQPDATQRLQYVAGVYYRELKDPDAQSIYVNGSGVSEPGVPPDVIFTGVLIERIREGAAFGEATYRWGITELTAGGRVYRIRTQTQFNADGLLNGGPSNTLVGSLEAGLSPKIELTIKPTTHNLIYALADKGFRPGGGNTPIPDTCAQDLAALGLTALPTQFRSDSLWNYEVGSKNTLLDGRLTLNANLFYMDWSKIQQSVALPHCGFGFTGNLGAAVSKGGEFDLDARLGRLTVHGGLVYDATRVTETAPGIPASVGDPVEQAPKVTAIGALDYSLPVMATVTANFHFDYQYHGSQAQSFNRTYQSNIDPLTGAPLGGVTTVADPSYLQPRYEVGSASVGLLMSHWSVRFIVQNLFDARPLLGMMSTGSLANSAFSLTPRTFVIAARFDL